MISQYINGNFIYFDNENDKFSFYKGNLIVENGKVLKFTNEKYDYETIDLKNNLVVPIFINMHLHLGETNFRPLKNKMSLIEYLDYTEEKNKLLGENSESNWIDSAKKTLQECEENGVHIINTLRGQNIIPNYSIKAFSGFPIMQSKKLEKFYKGGIDAYSEFCDECRNNNIVPGIFIHSFYTNDENSINFAKDCFKKSNTFVAVHIAEDFESENLVKSKWNLTSIEILKKYEMFNKKTILIHGNNLSKEELFEVKKYGANLVICPISTNNLKNEVQNVNYLIENKIPFSIASDGLATGESANLLLQTKFLLEKTNNYNELLKSITIIPQKSLNLSNEILSINSFANFNIFENTNQRDFNFEEVLFHLLNNDYKLIETHIEK